MQGESFLPAEGQIEVELNWERLFGNLEPGNYAIALDFAGTAHPPHPTEFIGTWNSADIAVIRFTIE